MSVKQAIEAGDAEKLGAALRDDPAAANATIRWGEDGANGSHPLQYVCDMRFEDVLAPGAAMPLIECLLAAGADVNARHEKNGDTPLIGAASLGEEDIGLRLLDAGADIHAKGLFNATALHWAAMLGLDRLVARLIDDGADIHLHDETHKSNPMEWAIHGWLENGRNNTRRQPQLAELLYRAGARARDEAIARLIAGEDTVMIAACSGGAQEWRT